jgi:hypothetical protein
MMLAVGLNKSLKDKQYFPFFWVTRRWIYDALSKYITFGLQEGNLPCLCTTLWMSFLDHLT